MSLFANDTAYDAVIAPIALAHAGAAGFTAPQMMALVKAVIRQESGFNPRAYRAEPRIGDASRGLMQLLGRTARALGYGGPLGDDTAHTGGLYDPATNIEYGTRLLVENLQRSGGNLEVAIAAYNAGWSQARPHDAPRTGTGAFVNADYVRAVEGYYNDYVQAPASGNGVTLGGVVDVGGSGSAAAAAVIVGGGLGLYFLLRLLLGGSH